MASTTVKFQPQTYKQNNRRVAKRDTLVTNASLWAGEHPDGSKGRTIWIFNISQSGMAFRSSQAAEVGVVHFLRLEIGPFQLASRVRIAWCRKREDNSYEIGAEFIDNA